MSRSNEYRAPREWHIEEQFGRFYVKCQYGGFTGWHKTREDALAQGRGYAAAYGDTFRED